MSALMTSVVLKQIAADRPAERLFDLDAARGLAIILVVVGHIVARGDVPSGNEWYAVLQKLIYRFHMPLFMVLAGITFALSLPPLSTWRKVAEFSARRIARLLVPYVILGVVVLVGKLVSGRVLHVDNPPAGSVDDVLRILLRPASSVAGFLWFIYVLALYLLFVPALFRIIGRRPVPLFLAGLAIAWLPMPKLFMLDEAAW